MKYQYLGALILAIGLGSSIGLFDVFLNEVGAEYYWLTTCGALAISTGRHYVKNNANIDMTSLVAVSVTVVSIPAMLSTVPTTHDLLTIPFIGRYFGWVITWVALITVLAFGLSHYPKNAIKQGSE